MKCVRPRLNVLYDVAYPFVNGGGQKRLFEVAKRLAAAGWNVRWFAFQTWVGAAAMTAHGIRYVGLPGFVPLYGENGRRSRREAVAFARAVWARRQTIRKAEVVWCGQWPYLHLLPLLGRASAPVVVDWWETWRNHWFSYAGWITGAAGFLVERSLAEICSRRGTIIAISPNGVEDVIAIGADPRGVSMIPNGIDLSAIDEALPSIDRVDVCCVGRLKDHKNIDHVIRAIHLLRVRHGLLIRADIIGSGPEESRLRELSSRLGLDSQIRFLGAINDAQKYARIKSAKLFVHPSTKEGGGSISLFESLACGTPVMIYDTPNGIDPSYVAEGVTGWIVAKVDPGALAERIAGLATTGKLDDVCRREDCRAAATSYGWDRIANCYARIFSDAVANRQG